VPLHSVSKLKPLMQAEDWLSAMRLLKEYSTVVDEDWELSWNFAWS
jgi:hypothetical protein